MSGFKVGDIAKLICDPRATPDVELLAYDGKECAVIGSFGKYPTWSAGEPDFTIGYVVRFPDGAELVVQSHELRKRHPPSTDDAVSRQAMLDCIERAKRGAEVPA